LKGPADEGGESAGLVLLGADAFEVFDAVRDGFDVAEHHGGAGVEALAVCDCHDLQPIVGHGFERGNALADAVDEDFAAAAGDGAEAGGAKFGNDFVEGEIEGIAEMDEFAGAEGVDVDWGKFGFDVGEEVEIPLKGKIGMVAALHENLRAAEGDGFFDFLVYFIE
jgi:hypothetical protein